MRADLLGSQEPKETTVPLREELSPILFGAMNFRLGKEKIQNIKILLDSGSSGTLIDANLTKNLRVKKEPGTKWNTASGSFTTDALC